MRVSLPVYPQYKTRAEVATLRWIHANTSIPVPYVFSFDDNHQNAIGYEWILMELMQGASAYKRWRTMTMQQKVDLVEQIADYQVQLSALSGRPAPAFRGIGALDLHYPVGTGDGVPLGRMVSYEFFMGDHIYYDVQRGPFRSSYDWLSAVLKIVVLHQTEVLRHAEDEDDKEEAEEISPVAEKLLLLLPDVFPPTLDQPERTGLRHHDLHLHNILVNEEGQITAVVDWECVSAMPLWVLTMVPKFLDGPAREEEPQRDLYADETPEQASEALRKREDPDYLDNEGKNELYFIHKMEYETTQLRKVYKAKVKELWPTWPLEESRGKVEFLQAISQCDGVWVKKAGRWAERMERNDFVPFEDA